MRFMKNPLFAQVYEHLWRPTFTRLFSFGGTATEDYDRALRAYLSRPGERLVLECEGLPGETEQALSRRGRPDGDGAGQEHLAHLPLEGLDPLREGRAGDPQGVRGGVEGAVVDGRDEGAQVVGVHAFQGRGGHEGCL